MTDATDEASRRAANLLGAVALALMDRVERRTRRHPNETSSATAALNVIGSAEGCSNTALSQALGLSHTTTVRLVDKLEASGLVTSTTGADRRFVSLALTPSGRDRAQALVAARSRLLDEALAVLPAADIGHLARIAETLLASFVATGDDGDHICRLCDEAACPEERCPVHRRTVALHSDDAG